MDLMSMMIDKWTGTIEAAQEEDTMSLISTMTVDQLEEVEVVIEEMKT